MLASLPFADQMEGLTQINKNAHKLELVPEKTCICQISIVFYLFPDFVWYRYMPFLQLHLF